MTTGTHRVVIIGGGFGGLFAARRLRRASVEVTIVDRTNHHLFQPLLYQVATGVLSEGEIAPPIRDVLRKQRNTRVLLGDVSDINLADRELVLDTIGHRTPIPYDSLIVAAGASQSYFGHDEFAAYAPSLKTIDDALELRGRIFGAFELAELRTKSERADLLTFVVVGAGPTGVELAGQIAELSRRALKRNYRTFDPKTARVILLEGTNTVLPPYPGSLQRRARRDLERLGIEVRLESLVTNVDAGGVDVANSDGSTERIQALVKVWAAGVQASPLGATLARQSGAEIDRAGRVSVLPDCTLPGHPEVFVIGDMINLDELPGVAEVAMQTGIHAARTIKRRVKGDDSERVFRYIDVGSMATIARFRAVVYTGRLRFAGLLGWLAWLFVHLVFLTGFKNRIATLANWTTAFLGRGRRQRTITLQQLFARTQQPPFRRPLPPGTNPSATSANGTGTAARPSTRRS